MASGKRKTFFLYAEGAGLDDLTLGSLVLDYKDPLLLDKKYKYIHRQLSKKELELNAKVRHTSSCVLSSKAGAGLKVNVEGAQLAKIGASLSGDDTIMVAGRNGKKIWLRDPEAFLNNEVLAVEPAKKILAIWISAARRRLLKPHVWFLTAMHQLDDARTFTSSTHEPAIFFEINSDIITALASVPIGGSIDLSRTFTVTASMIVEGTCVWAAQFRKLRIDFYWPWEDVKLPQMIRLYDNIYSDGVLYADEDPKKYRPPNRASVSLAVSTKTDTSAKDEDGVTRTSWTESESEDTESEDDTNHIKSKAASSSKGEAV